MYWNRMCKLQLTVMKCMQWYCWYDHWSRKCIYKSTRISYAEILHNRYSRFGDVFGQRTDYTYGKAAKRQKPSEWLWSATMVCIVDLSCKATYYKTYRWCISAFVGLTWRWFIRGKNPETTGLKNKVLYYWQEDTTFAMLTREKNRKKYARCGPFQPYVIEKLERSQDWTVPKRVQCYFRVYRIVNIYRMCSRKWQFWKRVKTKGPDVEKKVPWHLFLYCQNTGAVT